MSKCLKPRYYRANVEQLKDTKPNKWWSAVKSFMGNTKPDASQSLQSLANSESDGDLAALADKLNSFFQSISTDLPTFDLLTSCDPPQPITDRFIISVEDVEKRLIKTNTRKAVGPDNILNWILADCAPLIAKPLTSIFNSSIREGYIPPTWKSAIVTPVPKVNPPQVIEKDLRPISLTPVISKHLEYFIYNWLLDEIKDKIDPNQFGALKGSSTVHALVAMLHDWYKLTDDSTSGRFVRILLVDYTKAFDRIDPNILVRKLIALDISPTLISWICSFLTSRRQSVKIGNLTSPWLEIWGNAPQGTLL